MCNFHENPERDTLVPEYRGNSNPRLNTDQDRQRQQPDPDTAGAHVRWDPSEKRFYKMDGRRRASNWAHSAQTSLGGGVDDPTMKKTYVKTYMSPWEKTMKGDESLTATLKSTMPGPYIQEDLPKYKCFNRFAVPFGGFEKANQLLKFQLPDTEVPKEEPEPAVVYQHEIGCRPSFNRAPIGWVGSSEPSSIHMETDVVPFDVETDDL
ncbi:myozenin-1-like [Polymixia lowei]